jgi:hypothetical protein
MRRKETLQTLDWNRAQGANNFLRKDMAGTLMRRIRSVHCPLRLAVDFLPLPRQTAEVLAEGEAVAALEATPETCAWRSCPSLGAGVEEGPQDVLRPTEP